MPSNGSSQHIYIDTSYIQSFLRPKDDEERWRKEQVKKAIKHANKNRKIFIVFPLIVVGELINNLSLENSHISHKQDVIGEFFSLMENKKIDIKPARVDALKLAAEIKNRDSLLGETDLLIASQALCDIYSVNLLIHDRKIIESEEIANAEREIRDRLQNLKISDSIR